ncbi:putative dual-specificity RNA methyltransferase RlmN, partial [Bienertia sinuspersici]
MEDVGSTKMEQVSLHNEEKEIADDNNQLKEESTEGIDSYNDLPVVNCDIIVSRTLQLQRNKYLASYQIKNASWLIFSFYSEYKVMSILSIDENNPAVIQQNVELRHNHECSVLLDIINPANPDMHVCMTKMDFLSLAPKTWLTGASIDACSHLSIEEKKKNLELPENYINWLIDERKKKEYIESIIAEKEIDLEKAKDNPCYDTMKAEWLKDKQKMTYRESAFFADKCRQSMSEWEKMFPNNSNRIKRRGFDGLHHWNRRTIPFTWRSNQNDFDCGVYCIKAMEWYDGWNEKKHPITTLSTAYTKNLSRCHLAIDLVSYKENRRKQEVFKECALWSARKPFLIQQQKKRKDKEKHLENLRVKRVEKVFVEDEKIKKERERHEQE